jgi:hypothetical protein
MLQIFRKKNWLKERFYEEQYLEAKEINKMISELINSIKILAFFHISCEL